MTLFRTDAGKRTGRVDQRNNRYAKFLGQPHQAQRFAITFGMRAAEIAHDVFFRVASLLVRDDHATIRTEASESARHRLIIRVKAIAMQLDPIGETPLDIIEGEWTLRVARDLNTLPCAQVVVNVAPSPLDLFLHRRDLGIKID